MVEDEMEDKSGKAKYIVVGVVTAILVGLVITYCYFATYYEEHFLPGTVINGEDCGKADVQTVVPRLMLSTNRYTLEITGRRVSEPDREELLATVTAEDIDLVPVGLEQSVIGLLQQQENWLWIKYLWTPEYRYDFESDVAFNEGKLTAFLEDCKWYQKDNMIPPRDAYLDDYSESEKQFVIVPDTLGTQLDTAQVKQIIVDAILAKIPAVNLDESGCYKVADVTAQNQQLLSQLEKANLWLETQVTYDWNGNGVFLDRELLKDWITIVDGEPVLDEEAVAGFVAENAKAYDTYGKKRSFTTVFGSKITLPSGGYGWKTNRSQETQDLIELIQNGKKVNKEPAYSVTAANKGSNDIGSSYVEINLSSQHLYLFKSGKIVFESDFVSGNVSRGFTTPAGVFGITYKTTDAVLRGDNYETPVKYWMPFNGNIGMHDATWRSEFGGEIYLTNGSHGCVNLPYSSAQTIYQYVSTGFPVVCYY